MVFNFILSKYCKLQIKNYSKVIWIIFYLNFESFKSKKKNFKNFFEFWRISKLILFLILNQQSKMETLKLLLMIGYNLFIGETRNVIFYFLSLIIILARFLTNFHIDCKTLTKKHFNEFRKPVSAFHSFKYSDFILLTFLFQRLILRF